MSPLFALLFNLHFAFSPAHADASTVDNQFFTATRLLQESKFDEAFALFESEYKNGNDRPVLLYNWGLSAYHKKKLGLAAGVWRRALYLDPELSLARQGLEFIDKELPRGINTDSSSLWEHLNIQVLSKISLNKLLTVLWLFFLPAAFLLIRYFGRRVRALRDNLPLPNLPTIGLGFVVLFSIFLFLSAAKALSLLEVRATVIATSATLRTGPSSEDNSIFDLVEGLEVVVRQAQKPWVLIALPTGLSGWVEGDSLFQHTGKTKIW